MHANLLRSTTKLAMATDTAQKNIPKGWQKKQIKDLLDYERPDNYIVESTSYSDKAKTPVLTANKSFVLGYTDEDFGIYKNIPAIIFDDFTTDSKFVDFPFKIKSSAIKLLKNKDGVDLRFVYEKMKSINFPTGSHKRFYISQYQNMEVNIPPLTEQKKIAEILVAVDEEIQKTDEIIAATEKLKRGLMADIFKTKRGWKRVTVNELGKIVTGNTPKTARKENYGNDYVWVSPRDIFGQKYISESTKMLSTEGFAQTRKLPAGSILVVCIGSTIGKVGIAAKELSTNQQINSIVVNKENNNEFIYYTLLFNKARILEKVSTQAVPIINKNTFSDVSITVPADKDEQQKIAGILSSVDEKVSVNQKLKAKLTLLKKGLMQDLLSGTKRVKV